MTAPRLAVDAAIDARHAALRGDHLLRDDVVFLNHGSFGACPRPVFERYQAWQLELERQPVAFLGRQSAALLADARAALAAYVGADVDDLVYVVNATVGVNVIARSLELAPGDEILTTDHEYGAAERAWRFVAEARGAHLVARALPLPAVDPAEVVEAIWAGVTPRTRVLFLSHITSPTALILPLAELIARARSAGILTVVDGAHAPGQVPLDLPALGVDVYTGNCHKWLSAPKGAAFLYVRRELQHLLRPLVVSWGWRSLRPGPSRFVDEQQMWGTRDLAPFLTVPEAIRYQAQHDWDTVRAECRTMVRQVRDAHQAMTGLARLASDDFLGQMATLPLPPCDVEALKTRLYDEHRIEIPVLRFGGQPFVRVSVQGYNTSADLQALLDALERLLPLVATAEKVAAS